MPFPHLEILDTTNAVALILQSLPTGDLPVLCEHNGSRRKIASIANSAPIISALMKVTRLKYNASINSSVELHNNFDIMEVLG